MSDWNFLNKHRCRIVLPNVPERYLSDDSNGFNGLFRIPREGKIIRCVASDGSEMEGPEWKWQHVSVSIEYEGQPPKWAVMCYVKDLFWEPEDWVCQFHPAKSEYVNFHQACLHLWRPLAEKLPTPLAIMVGPKQRMPVG